MMFKDFCSAAIVLLLTASAASAHETGEAAKVTVVFEQELPNVPGKSMKGVLVEYGPGASNDAHTHPPSAFIYATVLEGAVRSQVNDGPVKTYRIDRKSTRLNSSHANISYAVFCLKK